MQKSLLELLICPSCLPQEKPLRSHIADVRQGDVHSAELDCPGCGRLYPVVEGLASLLPAQPSAPVADRGYESPATVSSYLWSHYADLMADPDTTPAYRQWAALLEGQQGLVLDTGCAVGRLTFELARNAELVIGIDRSRPFIETARALRQAGQFRFDLVMEGTLTEMRQVNLPPGWPRERTAFIQADALALPFPASVFRCGTSLNLLDKVPKPLKHLAELNRVTALDAARLLISDPWSWSTQVAAPEDWLGGTGSGPWAGHAHVNLRHLLENEFEPAWQVRAEGTVDWTIRNHRNHFERIRSDYLLAQR